MEVKATSNVKITKISITSTVEITLPKEVAITKKMSKQVNSILDWATKKITELYAEEIR